MGNLQVSFRIIVYVLTICDTQYNLFLIFSFVCDTSKQTKTRNTTAFWQLYQSLPHDASFRRKREDLRNLFGWNDNTKLVLSCNNLIWKTYMTHRQLLFFLNYVSKEPRVKMGLYLLYRNKKISEKKVPVCYIV